MLVIDTVGVALVLYWSMKNDRKAKGEPEEGWLRIADPNGKPPVQQGRKARIAASKARRL